MFAQVVRVESNLKYNFAFNPVILQKPDMELHYIFMLRTKFFLRYGADYILPQEPDETPKTVCEQTIMTLGFLITVITGLE